MDLPSVDDTKILRLVGPGDLVDLLSFIIGCREPVLDSLPGVPFPKFLSERDNGLGLFDLVAFPNEGSTSARRPGALEKIGLALAFDRESSDFLAGVNVESKEIFDPNTFAVVLSAPGWVSSGVFCSDLVIGVFADGRRDVVPVKICVSRFLGRPPVSSFLSSSVFFQEMPVMALSAPRRVGS